MLANGKQGLDGKRNEKYAALRTFINSTTAHFNAHAIISTWAVSPNESIEYDIVLSKR